MPRCEWETRHKTNETLLKIKFSEMWWTVFLEGQRSITKKIVECKYDVHVKKPDSANIISKIYLKDYVAVYKELNNSHILFE